MTKKGALLILDGYGYREEKDGNAVKLANTPNFDRLWDRYPHTFLEASGLAVGLPEGQMGNSEVGHSNIGAGRVVYQSLVKIQRAIDDRSLFDNQNLNHLLRFVEDRKSTLHLIGLLSDGGVHSHRDHLAALLKATQAYKIRQIAIHVISDGRDVGPETGLGFVQELLEDIQDQPHIQLASLSGRYYAMDRDRRYGRTEQAYRVIKEAKGQSIDDPMTYIKESYDQGVTDEFIKPTRIQGGIPVGPNDGVLFYNFRPDRMRQLTHAFVDEDFSGFDRQGAFPAYQTLTMMSYEDSLPIPVIFGQEKIQRTLGEVLSDHGLRQLRLAETEKYPHVTYFMNGSIEEAFPLEDRLLIPSPKVATYDLKPEMSVYEVTDAWVEDIQADGHDVYIVNFANPDMVGHTGSLEAAIQAVEAVDINLGRVVEALEEADIPVLIFADHGNAEVMVTEDGGPHTAHTSNPVPLIITQEGLDLKDGGALSDVAPTLLELLDIQAPEEMTGQSLIKKEK